MSQSTPAANPFDTRRIDGSTFAIIDTRDGRIIEYATGSGDAQAVADRLWHAELIAAPATSNEALATQLLAEVVDNDDQAAAAYLRGERYDGEEDALLAARVRKVQQLETLGYALTQGVDRQLCLAPLSRQAEHDAADLAASGLRLASTDESGWSRRTRDGRWLWVTDITPAPEPDETPSPPALTSCRIALPGGGWAVLDARGSFVGVEQAASAA